MIVGVMTFVTAVLLVAVFLARVIFRKITQHVDIGSIPISGSEFGSEGKRRLAYIKNAKSIYQDGYRKFKNSIFRITTTNKYNTIVIHPRYLTELKGLPDDVLSFNEAISESLFTEYTKVRADRPIIPHVVKKYLTPALGRLNLTIAQEVSQAFIDELPACPDFTEVNVLTALHRIVAKVSGRIFVGPELCRTEQYVDAAIRYTIERAAAQKAVSALPPWQRPFRARSLPEVKRLLQRTQEAVDFLRPVVDARMQAAADGTDHQNPDDMLQWILDQGQDAFGAQKHEELAAVQLSLTSAAIHTTSMTAANALYNLAAMPDLVPVMRKEIREALSEDGSSTTGTLQGLTILDSFLRETMRCYPLGWTSFSRKVLKAFTLSDGQRVPAGCIIEIAAYPMNHDPEFVSDPDTFDAFRFCRAQNPLCKNGGEKMNARGADDVGQFVTASPINLPFGYGRHACPGRFFAANELKMILSRALLDYDIKMPGENHERFPNIEFAGTSIPDPSKTLLFRKVVPS